MKNKLRERLANVACAFAMLFSSVSNTLTFPIKATAENETNEALTRQSFEIYPNGEEAEQVITLDGMMPKGAEAEAIDVSDAHDGIVAYDITINDGDSEYQPGENNPIFVEITDPNIPDYGVELWHITDEGERQQITEFIVVSGKLSFYATGFSVYEITEGPEKYQTGDLVSVTSVSDLTGENADNGFYWYYNDSLFVTNDINTNDCLIEKNSLDNAVLWYFEPDGNYYRIYIYIGTTKKYIYTKSGNTIELSENSFDLIEISNSVEGVSFYFKKKGENRWLQHSNGGGCIRYYNDNKNTTNSSMKLYFNNEVSIPDNYYNLDGNTYGFMNFTGGTHGYAMVAEDSNVHTLVELVTHQTANAEGITLYVDEGSEITKWTFHTAGKDKYKLSADTDESVKYLAVSESALVLVNFVQDASDFKVTPDNDGKIQLSSDGKYITFTSTDNNGVTNSSFSLSSNKDSTNTWLNLLNSAYLDDTDLITYSADRISVSDAVNGQKVIVYTRIWDDNTKKYDMYAVDYNGKLYPCYASGGKILWLGDGTGSLEWEFTEYYDAVTKEPNYYYELYNPYSEKYIAPQISSNQILSDSTIGINMQGRRNGDFYSEIVAWDNTKYAYVGMKPNDEKTQLIPCSQSACIPFYFATLEPLNLSDKLHEIATINNSEHGITMKMIDYPNNTKAVGALYNERATLRKNNSPQQ